MIGNAGIGTSLSDRVTAGQEPHLFDDDGNVRGSHAMWLADYRGASAAPISLGQFTSEPAIY